MRKRKLVKFMKRELVTATGIPRKELFSEYTRHSLIREEIFGPSFRLYMAGEEIPLTPEQRTQIIEAEIKARINGQSLPKEDIEKILKGDKK